MAEDAWKQAVASQQQPPGEEQEAPQQESNPASEAATANATGSASDSPCTAAGGRAVSTASAASDEDGSESGIPDNTVGRGHAGSIVAFRYYVKKTLRRVEHALEIHLDTQMVFVKGQRYSCHDFAVIAQHPQQEDLLNVSIHTGTKKKEKKWIFPSRSEATQFLQLVSALKESGHDLKSVFDNIDTEGNLEISADDLRRACDAKGLTLDAGEDLNMVQFAGTNHMGRVNFKHFFQLFMHLPDRQITTSACLEEWREQSRKSQTRNTELKQAGESVPDNTGFLGDACPPTLIDGEQMMNVVQHVRYHLLSNASPTPTLGNMYVTTYRLIFSSYHKSTAGRGRAPSTFATVAAGAGVAAPSTESATTSADDGQKLGSSDSSNNRDDGLGGAAETDGADAEPVSVAAPQADQSGVEDRQLSSDSAAGAGGMALGGVRIASGNYGGGIQTATATHDQLPLSFQIISIPLGTMQRVDHAKGESTVIIVCKDHRQMTVMFDATDAFVEAFVQFIHTSAFPGNCKDLFAFGYHLAFNPMRTPDGWTIYNVRAEFQRQGVTDSSTWRVWNDGYALADTYPREFVLPARLNEGEIMAAAQFRSRHRLPALTWRHPTTGAILARSSQPLVGVSGNRCMADEKLINLYRVRGNPMDQLEQEHPSNFYIFDARKSIAATGNKVAGKGVENPLHYANTRVVHCNIENIHAMRNSINALADLINQSSDDDMNYLTRLQETMWLRHVRLVIDASVQVAQKLHVEGASVLVHCSDGWDRTAQMCALAQLFLDPYYRTIEGFGVLTTKEWCSFGHKFNDRCGHGNDATVSPNERSPVYLQYLDCVHQILRQFPQAFEFTEELLIFCADHAYSGLFGDFLGNNERERFVDLDAHNCTTSMWTFILLHKRRFLNPHYCELDEPIWPCFSVRKIVLWERFFLRWNAEMHPRNNSGMQWADVSSILLTSDPNNDLDDPWMAADGTGAGAVGLVRLPSSRRSQAHRGSVLEGDQNISKPVNTSRMSASFRSSSAGVGGALQADIQSALHLVQQQKQRETPDGDVHDTNAGADSSDNDADNSNNSQPETSAPLPAPTAETVREGAEYLSEPSPNPAAGAEEGAADAGPDGEEDIPEAKQSN